MRKRIGKLYMIVGTVVLLGSLLISVVLVACGPQPGIENFDDPSDITPSYVKRIIDEEAGVVCYVYAYTERGGIDCLPISETKLDR